MKWMMWLAAVAVVLFVVTKVAAGQSPAKKKAAQEKISGGALVIDVRTAGEFSGGHYPGATNIPVQELSARLPDLGDTNRAVVVYCRSGNRSATAAKILTEAGFRDVTNAGGLKDMPKP